MGMNTLPSAIRFFRACRIRMQKPARHHQDSVRRGVRRSQLHSTSAGAAKAPYSLAPSSFPNCDRFAGSQFGDTRALPVLEVLFLISTERRRKRSGRLSGRKRKGANMKFSALAGNGMQRVFSDAAAVLFFLKKRKKRMGAQRGGRPLVAPMFRIGVR